MNVEINKMENNEANQWISYEKNSESYNLLAIFTLHPPEKRNPTKERERIQITNIRNKEDTSQLILQPI